MALERLGLGATLTADDQPFVQATGRARDALGRFIGAGERVPPTMTRMGASVRAATQQMAAGVKKIGTGINQLATGLRNASLGMLPVTAAIGAGVMKAANFEKQMSAVGAITRANESDMAALTKEAKRMGIVSVFSATQAGEGMEYLARAGANSDQIIAALQGTMNAAAADSIGLAEASDIVAQIVKGMGIEWGEASHVADVLALASARSNTNILGLGESFKYGVSQAKALGISLEETTAIFGKLADAGLKGSLAGTSFTNMMNKLAKPSREGEKIMKKWNITLNNADGSFKRVSDIVAQVSGKMGGIKNASEKARIATELFGIRGARAYNALSTAGKESLDKLQDELIASSAGIGAATEMANARLDNFLGRLTLFGASVESISIGIFGPLLKTFTPVVEKVTDSLNNVLFSLEGLNEVRQRENQENAKSAQLIAAEAAKRMELAGITAKQTNQVKGALQVLSRMRIGEEKLSSAQVEARKRALQSAMDAETQRRADAIKTRQLEAAGVKTMDQLGDARKKMVLKQIAEMTKARKDSASAQIDAAFKGGAGAFQAQKQLRNQILQETLATGKNLSESRKRQIEAEIAKGMELQAMESRLSDKYRAQIFEIETLQEIEKKHGKTALQMALGIQDAVDALRNAWDTVLNKVKQVGEALRARLGDEGVRRITKIITIVGIAAGAIAPMILALTMVGFTLSGLMTAFSALGTIASGVFALISGAVGLVIAAFWPIVAVAGVLVLAFMMIRREGESIGETFTRIWDTVKAGALHLYHNVLIPFIQGFRQAWETNFGEVANTFIQTWNTVVAAFTEVIAIIKQEFANMLAEWGYGTTDMTVNWVEMGKIVANVIMAVMVAAIQIIGWMTTHGAQMMLVFWNILKAPFVAFDRFLKLTFGGILDIMEGNFLRGIAKIAVAIFDTLTSPLRLALKGVIALADMIPGVKGKIPAGLKEFVEKGVGGMVWPKTLEVTHKAAGGVKTAQTAATKQASAITSGVKVQTTQAKGAADQVASLKAAVAAIGDLKAREKAKAAEKPEVKAELKLEDKRKLDITNKMCVDGESINVASARHKQEIQDRAGFKSTPWQRRTMLEHGAAPVKGVA